MAARRGSLLAFDWAWSWRAGLAASAGASKPRAATRSPLAPLREEDPLERLARRFDPRLFLRIHRSAFINLSALRELLHEGDRRYVAVLADRAATRIPVSREHLPALKAALGLS